MQVEVSEIPDKDWNNRLKQLDESVIYQTTYWGDLVNKSGRKAYYILSKDGDLITAQALITKEKYAKFFQIFTCYGGPVVFSGSAEAIVNEIDNLAKKNKTYFSKISSPYLSDLSKEFASYTKEDSGTFKINLTGTPEEIFSKIEKGCRKNVKRTEETVQIVKINDISELKQYKELMIETRERLELGLPPFFPDEDMWNCLRNSEGNFVEVFLAKQGDKVLSGLGVLAFNKQITEIGAGNSNYALENKIYSNDLIKWNIIKWGNQNGYLAYDLAGVKPTPVTDKERGIFRFKQKWGGELVTFPTYTKIYSKSKHTLINLLRRFK